MTGSYRSRRSVFASACLALAAAVASPARAEVTLASPFTSHMVLQRELPAPVWGKAAAGETVTVDFAGQKKSAAAGADGKWRVDLAPLATSGESRTMTITGSDTAQPIKLDDVLVGEVWLGSGQSNMEFKMSKKLAGWAGVNNEAKEIADANYPQVRMFSAKLTTARTPQDRVEGEWQVCTPENVPGFSAIGYFFARDLHRELNVPVGFLTVAYGASCAQAWIRAEAIREVPALKEQLDAYEAKANAFVPLSDEEKAKWDADVEKAKAEGKRPPGPPRKDPAADQHNPTTTYNGMLNAVVPYGIRGVIWYQGESITKPVDLFPQWNALLISDWRKLWGRELPFYFFQLAALDNKSNSPNVRAMQAEALKVPNTAMVVTIDIGDQKDVHPHNKQDAGARAARIALARDYGKSIEYVGPTFESATAEGGAMRVKLTHADGLKTKDGGPLVAFEVAGSDGKFVPAEAIIDGPCVVANATAVAEPKAVRYAWANYPKGANLMNGADLPAAPFRSEMPATQPAK